MQYRIVDIPNGKVAVVKSDEVLITNGQSALDFAVSIGYENDCSKIALDKSAVTEDFFDLKSGVAGEVAQKFVNFGYSLALIGDFSVYTSKSLHDFIYESNRGKYIFFVNSEQAAIEKLGKVKN